MGSIAIAGSGGSSGRTLLTGTTNYYVTATGSDSNNGSIGAPWLTIQHALNVIFGTLDFATQNVILNVGAGTFHGGTILGSVGGGAFQIYGAGSGLTTFTNADGTNATDTFDLGTLDTVVALQGLTLTSAASSFDVCGVFGFQTILNFGDHIGGAPTDIIFKPGDQTHCTYANPGIIAFLSGAIKFDGVLGTLNGPFATVGGNIQNFAAWTFINNPSWGTILGFASCDGDAVWFDFAGASYTGASTGNAYISDQRSFVSIASIVGSTGIGIIDCSSQVAIAGHINNFTVAHLPDVLGGGDVDTSGAVVTVSDSVSTVPGTIVVGGGSNIVTAVSNGTNWIILNSSPAPNYSTPITGFTMTLTNGDQQVILDPSGTIATGTITMAPNPVDKQIVTIRTSQIITTLTINGNVGQTIKGYTAGTLGLGGVLEAIYKSSNTTWYF